MVKIKYFMEDHGFKVLIGVVTLLVVVLAIVVFTGNEEDEMFEDDYPTAYTNQAWEAYQETGRDTAQGKIVELDIVPGLYIIGQFNQGYEDIGLDTRYSPNRESREFAYKIKSEAPVVYVDSNFMQYEIFEADPQKVREMLPQLKQTGGVVSENYTEDTSNY